MGLDAHALLFSKRIVDLHGPFGKTATIGRQEIHVPWQVFQKLTGHQNVYELGSYCERVLIDCYGSSQVDSFDNSTYEGASHVHDFNYPIPGEFSEQYDTVLDAGSLEHIYDTKTAIENFSNMIKPGGQIIHLVPANNQCGHGFYQFSPELFFSVYSRDRGFESCEVLLAKPSSVKKWFRVQSPHDGRRAEVYSGLPLVCLVRAQLGKGGHTQAPVQQSDYVHMWSQPSSDGPVQPSKEPDKQSNLRSLAKRLLAGNTKLLNTSMRVYFWLGQSSLAKMYNYRFLKGLNDRNFWINSEDSVRPK